MGVKLELKEIIAELKTFDSTSNPDRREYLLTLGLKDLLGSTEKVFKYLDLIETYRVSKADRI